MTMAVARAVVAGSRPGTTTHLSGLERTAAEKDAQAALAIPIPTASHKASSSLGSWSMRIGRSGCVSMRSGLGSWRAAEFNGAESLAPRPSVQIALGESKLSQKEEGRRTTRRRRGPIITARAESLWPPTRSTSMAATSLSQQETAVHVVDAPLSPSPSELSLPKREGLITIGLPKGSLQQATSDLFLRAGYNIKIHERSYLPDVDDKELNVVLFRGQEISRYVEDGVLDVGICGHDWVVENGSDVTEVCELNYSKATARPVRWVLAVPESSKVTSVHDLAGGIVATELIKTTERYFRKHSVPVQKVEYSWGATEVKALLPGVQAIVDITETGSSLRANKLRILDTILVSTTRLIANHNSWNDPLKREKIEDIAMLLQGAVAGRGKVGMKMNLQRRLLDDFTKLLPAEQSPTISPLLNDTYCAIEVVCTVAQARDLLPKVKRLGANGIFTYPLDVLIR